MSAASSERRRLDIAREELREAGLPKQPSVWLRANSGRRSMIETMATAWPKSRSYRRVEFDHRTSWRSTWKPNSLHTMASDPPAMNHPSDVLTIRRFVSDCLGFLLLCAALVHGKRNAFLGKSTLPYPSPPRANSNPLLPLSIPPPTTLKILRSKAF